MADFETSLQPDQTSDWLKTYFEHYPGLVHNFFDSACSFMNYESFYFLRNTPKIPDNGVIPTAEEWKKYLYEPSYKDYLVEKDRELGLNVACRR